MIELPQGCGIVLDLDDTLYPERSFHDSGFRWIARHVGLDPTGPEVSAASAALRSGGQPLNLLSASCGVPVELLLRWHREHQPDITLYPDASDFLDRLKSQDSRVVLLTDGRSITQRNKIESLGISDRFFAILISEERGHDKHGSEPFRIAEQLLGRSTIASFGDNPAKDIAEPLRRRWLTHLLTARSDCVHPTAPPNPLPDRLKVFHNYNQIRI